MTAIATATEELRLRLRGGLHEPGSPEYEDTCTLFNSMIEKRPRLVARCSTPDDVIAALAYAREQGMEIAVRAGGHSVAGHSLVDDGLVLDIRAMAGVEVDPERRVVRVGGGATWAAVDRATQEHGLATTGGRVSTTGVAGLTLGGGSGWLERKFGLAADSLVGAELVTADGEIVRADAHENPELLWALRGGGGNFGVVTALELELAPLGPEVFAGLLVYRGDRARDVLRFYRDVMEAAPDELSLGYLYATGPDEEGFPRHLVGEKIVLLAGMWIGSVEEGEREFRAIRDWGEPELDEFGPVPYADFQSSLDDPPGYRNYWTADHVSALPDEAIDRIVTRSEELPPSPSQLLIVKWGGAVARVGEDHSPLAGRDSAYVVHPLFLWEDPALDERMIELGRSFGPLLEEWSTGYTYLNFIGDEGHARVRAGFGDWSRNRLARVKAQWDPENVFRGNQNVPPAEPRVA
jgi:FAD/FMN-containing dehydrogenase